MYDMEPVEPMVYIRSDIVDIYFRIICALNIFNPCKIYRYTPFIFMIISTPFRQKGEHFLLLNTMFDRF